MRIILAVIVVLVALANPNRNPAMREMRLAYNLEGAENA